MTSLPDSNDAAETGHPQPNRSHHRRPDLFHLSGSDGAVPDGCVGVDHACSDLLGRLLDQAADGLTAEQARLLAAELADLQQRLASRPVIEQAKGILMAHFGIDDEAAFELLRRWSSRHNIKIRTISQQLAAAAGHHEPDTDGRSDSPLVDVINIFNRDPD